MVELHLGPHPATAYFARANHRDLFLHQFNQPDTAIGLAFGGKRSLRCEEALAGQPPMVIRHQFHDGIIPLRRPRFKPFLRTLGRRDEYTRNIASPRGLDGKTSTLESPADNRLRTVDFQAGLKVDPPRLARCPPALSIRLGVEFDSSFILQHSSFPLPPAYGLGDGAKPPEDRQSLPVAALHQLWQDGAGMNESEKQFSFTRAASVQAGVRKTKFLSVGHAYELL